MRGEGRDHEAQWTDPVLDDRVGVVSAELEIDEMGQVLCERLQTGRGETDARSKEEVELDDR